MNLLNLEDEKFKNVKIKGYNFKIRCMSPLDRVQIAQKRATLQGGHPVESFTQDDFLYFENIAIVDICTEELPKDFNQNESCIKWPDIELINELALNIKTHTLEFETKLKKNRPIPGGKEE
jgi:hypothetical protein